MLQHKSEPQTSLSSLGLYIRGVTYTAEDVTDSDGTLVMRANNITNGCSINYQSDVVKISKFVSKEQLLEAGDIVICMANGSSALIGKNSEYDGSCGQGLTFGAFCGVFRPKHRFVKWLFHSNHYRKVISQAIQGGNGAIANLSPSDILNMRFELPNINTLKSFDKLLKMVDSKLKLETNLFRLQSSQKSYLLSAMFI